MVTLLMAYPPPADSPRVVLVDDDAPLLRAFGRFLRHEGWDVTVLSSPLDALGAITDAPPDVVVTDQVMPEMTGVQLARALRGQMRSQSPILVALTGSYETLSGHDKTLFDEVLRKPCPPQVLLDTIERLRSPSRGVVHRSGVQLKPLKLEDLDDRSRTG